MSITANVRPPRTVVVRVPGPQGFKGEQGDTGPVGPQGPQGIQGVQGEVGPVGPQGDKGDKGDTGDVGPVGPQGVQGPTGETGPQGVQGVQGEKGDKGDKGDTGDTGPQGPQGEVGPQGPQGEKGDTGAGLNVLGTLNDESELPATGDPGDAYIIGENLFVWDGEDWLDAGQFVGPEGPQGPKGDTGDTGPEGPQGAQGEKGDAGDTGPPGPGVASGGAQGQVLFKNSATEFDTVWDDPVASIAALTDVDLTGLDDGFVLIYDDASGTWLVDRAAAGAKGGNDNEIFWENDVQVTDSYEITVGKNAGTFGPIEILQGVSVEVPAGSEWTIV